MGVSDSKPVVRAAGAVVVREPDGGPPEVALVHRPAYDDWTLPKGKLLPGESDEKAALREVEEETGMACRIDREVGSVTYLDRRQRQKVVRYWLMHPVGGTFSPTEEVDELRWMRLPEAIGLLSYERDRELLRASFFG